MHNTLTIPPDPGAESHASLEPLTERLAAIRGAEDTLSAAGDRMATHTRLMFFELLTAAERRRLPRLFPELTGDPARPGAPAAQRRLWDLRARAYLGRLLDVDRMVRECGLEVVQEADPMCDAGLLVLSRNGSLVIAGRPERHGRRAFTYEPIRRHVAGGIQGRGELARPLREGLPLRIGPLRLSTVKLIARGGITPDLDPAQAREVRARMLGASLVQPEEPETRAAGGEGTGRTHLEYLVSLGALHEAREAAPGEREVLECETLGNALHLQAEGRGRGFALGEVDRFFTDNGTRYEVVPRGDAPGTFDLVRRPRHGRQVFFGRARIEPQRLVAGAPVAIFCEGNDGEERTSFSGLVTEIVPTERGR